MKATLQLVQLGEDKSSAHLGAVVDVLVEGAAMTENTERGPAVSLSSFFAVGGCFYATQTSRHISFYKEIYSRLTPIIQKF